MQVTDPEYQDLNKFQQLYVRVTDALGSHDATHEDMDLLREEYGKTDVGDGIEALSPEGVAVLERIEALPRTGWDDPADVPDDTPDEF